MGARPLIPLLLTATLLAGCSETSGWPDDERAALRAICQQELGSPTPDQTFQACTCLYDRLPRQVSWADFQAWNAEPDSTKRDAAVTRAFEEIRGTCQREALPTE